MVMKFRMVVVFAAAVFITGCGSSQRDFKAEQQAYEAHKKEKEAEQGKEFRKVQEALRQKVARVVALTDFADNAAYGNDSTFFYNSDSIRFLSPFDNVRGYLPGSVKKSADSTPNAIVINTAPPAGGETPNANGLQFYTSRFIDRLRTCYRDSFFVDCYKISEKQLNELLAVRYVFVVDEILYAKPQASKGSDGFHGGGYLAAVYVFDLEDKGATPTPLCKFPVVGQNSESIQVNKYIPEQMKLESDLQKNCYTAFNTQCSKHFMVGAQVESLSLPF